MRTVTATINYIVIIIVSFSVFIIPYPFFHPSRLLLEQSKDLIKNQERKRETKTNFKSLEIREFTFYLFQTPLELACV